MQNLSVKLDYKTIEMLVRKNRPFQLSNSVRDIVYDKNDDDKKMSHFRGELQPIEEKSTERYYIHKHSKRRKVDPPLENTAFTFKVTTDRYGKQQKIDSKDFSQKFGGLVNDESGWRAKMKDQDCLLQAYIGEKDFHLGFSLTNHSGPLFYRNICFFGRTPTKATICAALLRLAEPKPGDILLDPMCGVGCIPIEAATSYELSTVFGSDNFDKCLESFSGNLNSFDRAKLPLKRIQVGLFDAVNLPYRDNTIDVIVTDMPFGKRVGKKFINRTLYKDCLLELARISRYGARLVVLTTDRTAMQNSLGSKIGRKLWKLSKTVKLNHGNLRTVIYVIVRTDNEYGKSLEEES